jgi:tRNA U34 5-methylaminomethyl-2-thiouridine-forming methyltransferase MnmC
LNFAAGLSLVGEFNAIHVAPWDTEILLDANFSLLKIKTTLQDVEIGNNSVDLVYYDAFAPSKQPELWAYPMLQKVANGLRSGGVLVTYCAKGQLKRDLKSLGLMLEVLPGPPGKKEMVRACKL